MKEYFKENESQGRKFKISVVVIQYEPDLEAMLRTLESIVVQEGIDFDVVIADDGSKTDYFPEIRNYMEKRNFKNYSLVKNETNRGTVENSILGIENAKGRYVHVTSPGDLIYSKDMLFKIASFMELNHAHCSFGRAVSYNYCEEKLNIFDWQHPVFLQPYRKHQIRRMKRHLLIYRDLLCGATYSWDRAYYLDCLKRIRHTVKYCEDLSSIYPVLDNKGIYFMDEYVVYYEYGSGISTGGDAWKLKLHKDEKAFWHLLCQEYKRDLLIKRANKLLRLDLDEDNGSKKKNKIKLKICGLDRSVYNKIHFKLLKRETMPAFDLEFLKKILERIKREQIYINSNQNTN